MALISFTLFCVSEHCVAGREGERLQSASLNLFCWLMTRHEHAVMAGICAYPHNFISVLVLCLPVSSDTHWVQGNGIAIAIGMSGRDGS